MTVAAAEKAAVKAKNRKTRQAKKVAEGGEEAKGDWICNQCFNHNYSFRAVCNRCSMSQADNQMQQ